MVSDELKDKLAKQNRAIAERQYLTHLNGKDPGPGPDALTNEEWAELYAEIPNEVFLGGDRQQSRTEADPVHRKWADSFALYNAEAAVAALQNEVDALRRGDS